MIADLAWPLATVLLGLIAWEAWRRTLAVRTGKLSDKLFSLEIELSSLKTSREYQRDQDRTVSNELDKLRTGLRDLTDRLSETGNHFSKRIGEVCTAQAKHLEGITEVAGRFDSLRNDNNLTIAEHKNEIRTLHERVKTVHGDLAKFGELTMKEFERLNGAQSIKNVAAGLQPSAAGQNGSKPF